MKEVNLKENRDMKIAIVSTIKASINDTESFINYHLNIGIDHIYLFFDNPDDPAIRLFSNNPRITSTRCTDKHWNSQGCNSRSNIEIRQIANANLALKWARESNTDWISHIDVDELIYSEEDIKSILSSIPQNVHFLTFPPLEAIPIQLKCNNPYKEINNFKVVIKDEEKLNGLPRKDELLYLGEYFRSHLGGKSFTRTNSNVSSLEIHKPTLKNDPQFIAKTEDKVLLLHFDCYDYSNWLSKWLKRYDGSAKFSGRENRNKQFDEFCSIFEKNNENELRALYKKNHLISHETIMLLKEKNAVRTVNLDLNLFNKPVL